MPDDLDEIALNVLLAEDVSPIVAITGSTIPTGPTQSASTQWALWIVVMLGLVLGVLIASSL